MNDRYDDPRTSRQNNQNRGSPSHPYESISLVRIDPDVVAMLVECVDDVVNDARCDGGSNQRSHESDETEQRIGHGGKLATGEETDDRTEEGNPRGSGRHAIKDKHDFAGKLDCFDGILDCRRPVEAGQVDARFQLRLKYCGRIEMEHSCLVGTSGDIQRGLNGRVGDWAWGIKSLAIVENVSAVEVMDAQVAGDSCYDFVDVALDGAHKRVE